MYVQYLNIQRLVDVGSHKGEFLQIFTSVSSIKTFFCFEPQKLAYDVLKKNFKKNKKIKTFNYALGDRNHKKKDLAIKLASLLYPEKDNYKMAKYRYARGGLFN